MATRSRCIEVCSADSSNMCPLIEKREVLFDPKFRQKVNKEEYEKYPGRIAIELVAENGTQIHYSVGSDTFQLDYEKLIKSCETDKECKIYVRISGIDSRGQLGSLVFWGRVTISLGEIMRISSIDSFSDSSPLVMGVEKPMINTIILYSK